MKVITVVWWPGACVPAFIRRNGTQLCAIAPRST